MADRLVQTETMAEMRRRLNESMTQQFTMRTRAEVTRFFDGLRLVDPGVVLTHEWRPDSGEESATPGPASPGNPDLLPQHAGRVRDTGPASR